MEDSAGRKDTLATMLRSNTLWGDEYFAEVDDNSAGDTIVVLEVLMDFAGGKKTLSTTLFPWLLAEDNPVISY